MDLSVILPCRNEEKTLKKCILQIKECFKKNNLIGEIIVSDSSIDSSPNIAKKNKVKLVKHNEKGYGIAIMKGFETAKGKIIVIGDADGTYDFSQIPLLLKYIHSYDLVIGNRLKGTIMKGAMPFHHRYIGNPLLSFLLKFLFKSKIGDAHSGFRVIKKKSLEKLCLKTTGMEFASEMIIKAIKNKMKIAEVPITYFPRIGISKLNSISDGWRHLRFMIMFSPTYLFLVPGILLFLLGGILIYLNKEIVGILSILLGYQLASIGIYSKIYSIHTGFEKDDFLINLLAANMPLERGILLSFLIFILGICMYILNPIISLTLAVISIQTFFSIFFISMMLIEKK